MGQATMEREPRAWAVHTGDEVPPIVREDLAARQVEGEWSLLPLWHGDPVGDLGRFASRDEIYEQLLTFYGPRRTNTAVNVAGQFWSFAHEVEVGDFVVVTSNTDVPTVAIGCVVESYRYRPRFAAYERHTLTVEWLRIGLARSVIRADLRASLSSLVSIRELDDGDAVHRVARLAEDGMDPGPRGPEQRAAVIGLLASAAARASGVHPVFIVVAELLKAWGYQQRNSEAVAEIKADLLKSGLTTSPPFTEAELNSLVKLVAIDTRTPQEVEETTREATAEHGGAAPSDTPPREDRPGPAYEPDETENLSETPPLVMLVGHRTRATETIGIDASPAEAWLRMTEKRYSQLAVVDDKGTYLGAVTSESFLNDFMGPNDSAKSTLRDLLDDQIPTVYRHEHLLDRLELVTRHGFVFVIGDDRKTIVGILSATDLAAEFGAFYRPFMILEEIENRLRAAVNEKFTLEEIKSAARLKSVYVDSAANMMMGDYVKMFKNAANWRRLAWGVPQDSFIEKLETVARIRNDIMHFSPDPLDAAKVEAMTGFQNIMRQLVPSL